jgi:hypothetical protein
LNVNIQDKLWNYSNKSIKYLINLFRYTNEHSSNYFHRTINWSKDICISEFNNTASITEFANIYTDLTAEYSDYQVFYRYAKSSFELIQTHC